MNIGKIFTLIFVSLVAVASFASADSNLTINEISPMSYSHNATFQVVNTGSTDFSSISLGVDGSAGFTGTLSQSLISSLNAGNSSGIITLFPGNTNNLKFGTNTLTVTATSGSTTASKGFNFEKTFCSRGQVGTNLSISDFNVENKDDSDDEEWRPFDNVKVEVEVSNTADDDMDDVVVELALFDSNGRNVIGDMIFTSNDEEEQSIGRIRENKDEQATFEFKVPADMDEGNYRLTAKAYSDDTGENRDCVDTSSSFGDSRDYFTSIDISKQDDDDKLIVVDDIVLPEQTTCNEIVNGQLTVFNVGDSDQDDVRVNMFSSSLGLNQNLELRDQLDEGDDQDVAFSFKVPAGTQNMVHSISFRTYYEDGESDETFEGELNVIGCSGSNTGSGSDVEITTSPVTAQAGKSLSIQSVITNRGTTQKILTLTATGYQSWASSAQVLPNVVTLAPGASQAVVIQMNVNDDASGSESFYLQMTSDGQVEVQPIEVPIQSVASSSGFNLGGSTMIWIIAAVNILLILLIVVVAIKMSRR